MKQTILILLWNLILWSTAVSQLLTESFPYSTGDISGQGGWAFLTTDNAINLEVISGSLSYSGYFPSGVLNSVQAISGSSRDDCAKSFTASPITTGAVYASMLVKVNGTPGTDSDNDGYFFCLMEGTGTNNYARLSVVAGATVGTVQFGIQRNSGTGGTRSLTTEFSNTGSPTFLLVVKHDLASGTSSVFVNPVLSGIEPAPDATNATGTTFTQLQRIQIRQGGDAGDCDVQIDEIKVGTAWGDSPLPVQLASFTAYSQAGRGVLLRWRTLSEVNNYGFFVQREDANLRRFVDIANGFVAGNGTTNEPQEYSFLDTTYLRGRISYRLRQVDLDGTIHFSEPIQVTIATEAANEREPLAFTLFQNYPNPFNPVTTIRYSIPVDSDVHLKLFTAVGAEVATLVAERRTAGTHEFSFDASSLPSGVYIYRLAAGRFVASKKLILLK